MCDHEIVKWGIYRMYARTQKSLQQPPPFIVPPPIRGSLTWLSCAVGITVKYKNINLE